MSGFWLGFFTAAPLAASIGLLMAAFLVASKRADGDEIRPPRAEKSPRFEPPETIEFVLTSAGPPPAQSERRYHIVKS